MDLKRLVSHFAYKIEPKPGGGFIARATDPAVPPLEAPTREELQEKVRQNILSTLSTEFPGLKLPADSKKLQLSFHVEHKPGGGFSIHSSDAGASATETAGGHDFESRFLENLFSFAGAHLAPEMSKALSAQVGRADIKVVVNGKTSFHVNTDAPADTFGAEPAGFSVSDSSGADSRVLDAAANPAQFGGTIGNNPILPESNNAWKIVGLILALLVAGAATYFFFFTAK